MLTLQDYALRAVAEQMGSPYAGTSEKPNNRSVHSPKRDIATFLPANFAPALASRLFLYMLGTKHLNVFSLQRFGDANFHFVHALDFSGYDRVTNSTMARIGAMGGGLVSLNLSGCKNIDDDGLDYLERVTNLTSLNLSKCNNITYLGLQVLSKLHKLVSLDLSYLTGVSVQTFATLALMKSLEYLNLSRTRTDDACVTQLVQPLLSSNCSPLSSFSGLYSLTTLTLRGTLVTDRSAAHFVAFPSLTDIDLLGSRLTERGLNRIGQLYTSRNIEVALNPAVARITVRRTAAASPARPAVKPHSLPTDDDYRKFTESLLEQPSRYRKRRSSEIDIDALIRGDHDCSIVTDAAAGPSTLVDFESPVAVSGWSARKRRRTSGGFMFASIGDSTHERHTPTTVTSPRQPMSTLQTANYTASIVGGEYGFTELPPPAKSPSRNSAKQAQPSPSVKAASPMRRNFANGALLSPQSQVSPLTNRINDPFDFPDSPAPSPILSKPSAQPRCMSPPQSTSTAFPSSTVSEREAVPMDTDDACAMHKTATASHTASVVDRNTPCNGHIPTPGPRSPPRIIPRAKCIHRTVPHRMSPLDDTSDFTEIAIPTPPASPYCTPRHVVAARVAAAAAQPTPPQPQRSPVSKRRMAVKAAVGGKRRRRALFHYSAKSPLAEESASEECTAPANTTAPLSPLAHAVVVLPLVDEATTPANRELPQLIDLSDSVQQAEASSGEDRVEARQVYLQKALRKQSVPRKQRSAVTTQQKPTYNAVSQYFLEVASKLQVDCTVLAEVVLRSSTKRRAR